MNSSAPDGVPNPLPATPGKPRRRMSWFRRIQVTLVLLVLFVLFAEFALQLFYRATVGRWLWEWWAVPIFEPDPVRVYRVKANLDYLHQTREFSVKYCTDDAGFRTDAPGPGPIIPKPRDHFRVLSLGPSFAFGWAAANHDCYSWRIAEGIQVAGKKVELLNLGTPSQPASYQNKWLKEKGAGYEPDLILQTVFGDPTAFDADDTLPAVKMTVNDGYLRLVGQDGFMGAVKRYRSYSAFLHYGWYLYMAISGDGKVTGDGREFYSPGSADAANADAVTQRLKSYVEFVHRAVPSKPLVVFLYVPESYLVNPADVKRYSISGALQPLAERERRTKLLTHLRAQGIAIIDPTPALVEKDKQARTYYLMDVHFTPAGNQVVADQALPEIRALLERAGSSKP
jgi:hypothetical protein